MLNGDDPGLFFQNGPFDQAVKQGLYKPMLHQFCIAINGVKTRFFDPSLV